MKESASYCGSRVQQLAQLMPLTGTQVFGAFWWQ